VHHVGWKDFDALGCEEECLRNVVLGEGYGQGCLAFKSRQV